MLLPVGLLSYGQLPLPQVPSDLTDTQSRADYVGRHFYDAMDWTDASMTAEEAQTQAWVNFLSILAYASEGTDAEAVAGLFSRIPAGYVPLYTDLAEAYLLSADSELVSERLYTAAMTALTGRSDLPAADIAAPKGRLEYLKLNAPGSVATDFEFTAPDGRTDRMSNYVGKSPYLLIVFHDPDCDVCHDLLGTLESDPHWLALQNDGTLRIITPEITDELEEAFRMLYTPSLYLLDREGQVIVRNVLLDKISASISH